MKNTLRPIQCLLAMILIAGSPALGATATWDGGNASNNIWSSNLNWTGDVLPTFDNTLDVIYGSAGADYTSFPVRIQGNRTIRSLTFNDDADTDFFTNLTNNAESAALNLTFEADSGDASITITSGAGGNFGIGRATGTDPDYGTVNLNDNLNVIHNGAGTLTINRRILGTGAESLVKTGTGEMIIELGGPANTYGNTTVAGGRLTLNRTAFPVNTLNGALGSGTLTIGAASGTADAELQFGSQGNAFSTAFTVAGGSTGIKSIRVENSGSNNIDISSNITLNDALTVNAVTAGRVTTLSGTLTGANGLTINAGNQQAVRVDISGNNAATYSGSTTLSRGRTYGRHDNAFGTGTILLGDSGASFAALYSGNDVTIGNNIIVDGSAAQRRIGNAGFGTDADGATFTGNILLNGDLQVEPDGDASGGTAVTLTGMISGVGGLQIDGGANRGVIISGTNTYMGTTSVNAGSLLVNGNNSGATGAVTVAAGATLGGSGSIGGASNILGIHAPGNSPGIQDFASDLTYSGGSSSVIWELTANTTLLGDRGTFFDGINVGGNLDFAGTTTLTLDFDLSGSSVDWSDLIWGSNQSWLLYDVAGSTSNLSNFSLLTENWTDKDGDLFDAVLAGSSFNLSQLGSDVYLNFNSGIIPEPSRAVLLTVGFLGLALRRRRA